jgi:hypothetical protein
MIDEHWETHRHKTSDLKDRLIDARAMKIFFRLNCAIAFSYTIDRVD